MMYEHERQSLIDCALEMERHHLVARNGGNVSARLSNGDIIVTPSAMDYHTMSPDDIVRVTPTGRTLEGVRRPSSDLTALLFIFSHMPDMNAVIHTHQPYATALSLIADELPADFTTVIDELHGAVSVAPFTRSSDTGMGIASVRYAKGSHAVILKHHGAMVWGETVDAALTTAIYLEEACKCYLLALSTGLPISHLTTEQIQDEAEERGFYGQMPEHKMARNRKLS